MKNSKFFLCAVMLLLSNLHPTPPNRIPKQFNGTHPRLSTIREFSSPSKTETKFALGKPLCVRYTGRTLGIVRNTGCKSVSRHENVRLGGVKSACFASDLSSGPKPWINFGSGLSGAVRALTVGVSGLFDAIRLGQYGTVGHFVL